MKARQLVKEWIDEHWKCSACEVHAKEELIEMIQQALADAWDQGDLDTHLKVSPKNPYKS